MSLVSERVPVKQKGRDFWACCPLHHEKTPSFKMDPSTQLWHCFGCGEGGGVFDLVMKLDELSFPEAVRKLAERAHIEIQETREAHKDSSNKQRLKDACAAAAAFYHTQLMRIKGQGQDEARAYLGSRGLGGTIPKTWNLGYAPGGNSLVRHLGSKGFDSKEMIAANLAIVSDSGKLRDRFYKRIIFPIRDIAGDTIAFGGRTITDSGPKYLNSQETPIFHKSQVLFGLDMAKSSMASSGRAIVTEGYTDVIAMHEAGLKNTVASLGTSLTSSHVRTLSRHAGKSIIYIFDGDEAGQRATERALQFIDKAITPESGSRMIDLRALCLPDGLDPADYLAKHSADELLALIDDAKPLILFGIERRISRHNVSTIEGRTKAATDALDVLAPIKDSILAKDYARQIASMLNLHEEDLVSALSKLKVPRSYSENSQQTQNGSKPSAKKEDAGEGQRTKLTSQEKSRIKTERELLGLLAQNPTCLLSNAEALSKIDWHSEKDKAISQTMMAALMEHPSISASELVGIVEQSIPGSGAILTSARTGLSVEVTDMIDYLREELQIGDMEQRLAILRGKLGFGSSDTKSGEAFEETVKLQADINAMKNSHKLPE